MNIGQKILSYITRKNIPVADLAERIDIDASQLEKALTENNLDIKTLEKISKELRIPLYSFFTNASFDDIVKKSRFEIPYYIERLDPEEKSDFRNLITGLIDEIEHLKIQLNERDMLIEQLRRLSEED